jgi:O-antigen/teichoic acid export membrane protein
MLGKVSFVAVGIYAAAYRIIDVSMTPIRSLISAAYPRFFEKGLQGMKSTYPYALTQIGRATLYSVVLVPVLWIAAPLLPRILGEHYANTISALRWLALLPVLRGVHSFLADSLSGAGFQGFRSAIQVMVALVNIGLNLVILPRYGWLGAAWTSLASDGLLVVSFWVAVRYKVRIATPARLSQVIV